MTIEAVIASLDGVDEKTRDFYTEKEGQFVLDVSKYTAAQIDGATSGLKAKVDELLGETKAAKKARDDAAAEAAAKAEEAARKAGDTEALEKSWQEKLAKREAELTGSMSEKDQLIERLTVGNLAKDIAGELAVSGSAGVLERLIAPRLAYEIKDGEARVVVKDAQGKPSASTVDELKAELKADAAFAPLIAASKGTGGGAANKDGGAGSKATVTRAQWDSMSHLDRAAHSKSGGKVVDK